MKVLWIEGVREDWSAGKMNLQVQPSAVVKDGVFISVNQHLPKFARSQKF